MKFSLSMKLMLTLVEHALVRDDCIWTGDIVLDRLRSEEIYGFLRNVIRDYLSVSFFPEENKMIFSAQFAFSS